MSLGYVGTAYHDKITVSLSKQVSTGLKLQAHVGIKDRGFYGQACQMRTGRVKTSFLGVSLKQAAPVCSSHMFQNENSTMM